MKAYLKWIKTKVQAESFQRKFKVKFKAARIEKDKVCIQLTEKSREIHLRIMPWGIRTQI